MLGRYTVHIRMKNNGETQSPKSSFNLQIMSNKTLQQAKGDSGKVVWAKMGKFPWWPAQVLAEKDPFIPKKDAEPPRRGAVPVRFFGALFLLSITQSFTLAAFRKNLLHSPLAYQLLNTETSAACIWQETEL